MNKIKTYICPECNKEARFKGLCRDCTEYDSEGNIINAVRREEAGKCNDESCGDESCGHTKMRFRAPTAEMFRQRRRPKLTKKQMSKYHQILTDNNFTDGTVDEARQILLNHEGEEE